MQGDDRLEGTFSAQMWSGIDGDLDNTAAVASQNGEDALAAACSAIRRLGWDAGTGRPQTTEVRIVLDREQWELVLRVVEEELEGYRFLELTEEIEGGEAARDALRQLLG